MNADMKTPEEIYIEEAAANIKQILDETAEYLKDKTDGYGGNFFRMNVDGIYYTKFHFEDGTWYASDVC